MRPTPFALGALLAVVLAFTPTAGMPSASAATPCWRAVIADWSRDGTIDRTYPAACYRQAMQNAPTDLKVYSTLEDDLQSALSRRTARRLAGAHVPPMRLDAAGGSSFTLLVALVALVAGLGGLVALCSAGAALARRR